MDAFHKHIDRAVQGKAGNTVDNFAVGILCSALSFTGLALAFWDGWKEQPPLFLKIAGAIGAVVFVWMALWYFIVGCLAVSAKERQRAAAEQELGEARAEAERLRQENAQLRAERDTIHISPR